MSSRIIPRFDALIVGGGLAGSATAAALCKQGLRPLLCETGLPSSRRLAGELMHPPSAERLANLGLLEPLLAAGAAPVYGFVIFQGAQDSGTLLSYSEVPGCRTSSIALEHCVMSRTLLSAVAKRPGLTVWDNARVTAVDFARSTPRATILREGKTLQVEAPLVVSAEGRNSKIRNRAGIKSDKGPAFRMLGWKIPGGRLPFPGYGHVFLGGRTATLAYQVSRTEVRVMFENELEDGKRLPEDLLACLPQPFQADVRAVVRDTPPQVAKVYGLVPRRYTARNLAVVGDAAGCVHPVTASGLAYCTADAVGLAQCMSNFDGSSARIAQALERYERERHGPMRTRVALGPALVDAFTGQGYDMKLLRYGLFQYWTRRLSGRHRSVALLATHDQSMKTMALEYALVAAHAMGGLRQGIVPLSEMPGTLASLAKRTASHVWAEFRM